MLLCASPNKNRPKVLLCMYSFSFVILFFIGRPPQCSHYIFHCIQSQNANKKKTIRHLIKYALAGSSKTIVEKWPGSCKGKEMRGYSLTWGDAETIRRVYNCSDHVSNAKFVILLQVNKTICENTKNFRNSMLAMEKY
jgi:hypothetical protein